MIWIVVTAVLCYLLIGAVLVARVFGGMAVEAEPRDMLYLVIFWPLAISFFAFLLKTRRAMQKLEQLNEPSD